MKMTQLTLTACAAMLASSVALAAEPPKFKDADSNGDGAISADEYKATKAKQEFAKLDKDKNGSLSKKEYSAIFDEECE